MQERIAAVRAQAEAAIRAAASPEALEEARRRFLGRAGDLSALLRGLGALPAEERAAAGKTLNDAKAALETLIGSRAAEVVVAARDAALREEALDVTLPGRRPHVGRPHVLGSLLVEVVDIFRSMGFDVAEGPEIEDEDHNFRRLNFAEDHPARDAQDCFYLDATHLLRTHTTSVDTHVMMERRPPMRVVTVGRCYRRDLIDATHMPVFHQVDGFVVDENIRFSDLKGILSEFARQLFGPETKTRLTPSYFPFTEPSAETAVRFRGRWLEMGGCGMFHPHVLEAAGIDPERYAALAFGWGVERPAMVRHRIPDLRLFWDNDVRFLRKF
ncbi:MAG: phenylalanine--tRNA ligase subunit alpha [Armatimonadetes bacterium]|nr:phenylalanine--tRNA ligase subunit alpha [Armatimonadota bacterium]